MVRTEYPDIPGPAFQSTAISTDPLCFDIDFASSRRDWERDPLWTDPALAYFVQPGPHQAGGHSPRPTCSSLAAPSNPS
jgi:hypothetical protein